MQSLTRKKIDGTEPVRAVSWRFPMDPKEKPASREETRVRGCTGPYGAISKREKKVLNRFAKRG